MRINELYIRNLKGIREVHMKNVPDIVVKAGPNGCGKSSVLDGFDNEVHPTSDRWLETFKNARPRSFNLSSKR